MSQKNKAKNLMRLKTKLEQTQFQKERKNKKPTSI
jgi:hypothetical protein